MIKVIQLLVNDHPILGDQSINFIGNNEEHAERYVTLMIGQNGTGKTQILKALIDIFFTYNNYSFKSKDVKWNGNYQFSLIFVLNEDTFTFKSSGTIVELVPKTFETKKAETLDKLIVSAYTFNDKFPRSADDSFYYYGGLKTTTNNIFLNKPTEDTFRNLAKIIQAKERITYLTDLFQELDFEKKIKVYYRSGRYFKFLASKAVKEIIERNRNRAEKNITDKDAVEFIDLFINFSGITKKLRTKRFQETGINRILNDLGSVKHIISYLLTSKGAKDYLELSFEYDWDTEINKSIFFKHIDVYKLLLDLGILSFSHFQVFRKNYFNFEEASSGEFHLIHLASSILANIEKNSLILIDEPEISLHVNWQNRFFKFLQPIFKNFPESHFIIASHSHFLVSNLHNKWSSIVSLRRNSTTRELYINLLENINPEGWSAEQILFDVFNSPTDRNYYLTMLVEDIISELSKPKQDEQNLSKLMNRLEKFDIKNLHPKDPITSIIQKLLSYGMEQK